MLSPVTRIQRTQNIKQCSTGCGRTLYPVRLWESRLLSASLTFSRGDLNNQNEVFCCRKPLSHSRSVGGGGTVQGGGGTYSHPWELQVRQAGRSREQGGREQGNQWGNWGALALCPGGRRGPPAGGSHLERTTPSKNRPGRRLQPQKPENRRFRHLGDGGERRSVPGWSFFSLPFLLLLFSSPWPLAGRAGPGGLRPWCWTRPSAWWGQDCLPRRRIPGAGGWDRRQTASCPGAGPRPKGTGTRAWWAAAPPAQQGLPGCGSHRCAAAGSRGHSCEASAPGGRENAPPVQRDHTGRPAWSETR